MQNEWFESWFDSSLYDILYQHRNEKEAAKFIDSLFSFLDPKPKARILDLACGSGRHTVYMQTKGYRVIGADLSERMIKKAKSRMENGPEFFIHDMRKVFRVNYFDNIFSFFTSFGYFERQSDNLKMLRSVHAGLKQGGQFVLDYLNPEVVRRDLVEKESRELDGWQLVIERQIVDNRVVKRIRWERGEQVRIFEERVSLFSKIEMKSLVAASGLKIVKIFGDYELNTYDANSSDRMIILANK